MHVSSKLGGLGATLGHLDSKLRGLGAILEPRWGILGPSWIRGALVNLTGGLGGLSQLDWEAGVALVNLTGGPGEP